jgi:hypothetical protein
LESAKGIIAQFRDDANLIRRLHRPVTIAAIVEVNVSALVSQIVRQSIFAVANHAVNRKPILDSIRRVGKVNGGDDDVNTLLRVFERHVHVDVPDEACCPVWEGALRLMVTNLFVNALKFNKWSTTVTDPGNASDIYVRVTSAGSKCGDGPTVTFCNLIEQDLRLQNRQLPVSYETWWRTRGADRRGGRLVMRAVRHLVPEIPNEESSNWVEVGSFDPFTVTVHLPSADFCSQFSSCSP